MRTKGSVNKKYKYTIELYNTEGDIIESSNVKSYQEIVNIYPVFNHQDNVRAFLRTFSKECKTKKTKNKYGCFKIYKIEKV